jgi:Flp pilus assembly protein TadG
MRPGRRSPGQSLVEFALVLPIFLLVVVALVDLGRGVFAYNSITNGAREAARLAIVNQDPALVLARGVGQVAIAETASPSVSVTYRVPTPNVDPRTNPACTPINVGCIAVVTFETTFRPVTPLISSFLFPAGVKLTAVSTMPVEFLCPNATTAAAACPKQP